MLSDGPYKQADDVLLAGTSGSSASTVLCMDEAELSSVNQAGLNNSLQHLVEVPTTSSGGPRDVPVVATSIAVDASAGWQLPVLRWQKIQLHMLTHTPYAAWCEAFVSMKGKDRRETDPTRIRNREIPVLSFDFAYTGKSMDDESDEDGLKLTTLVVHDSHSGSLNCVPLKGKDAKHAVREMVKYLQYFGPGDVCLRCDQEPAIVVIQSCHRSCQLMLPSQCTRNISSITDFPKKIPCFQRASPLRFVVSAT